MAKHIISLSDGTWNHPDQDEDKDGTPDVTNVYKLYLALAGSTPGGTPPNAKEQEKELHEGGSVVQIAKYLHGVGDSKNAIHKFIGGVFGGGLIARVVRGYTFISRNYEPGAEIHVLGFSRGAYTARALAGLIASQGLLGTHITQDKEKAYKSGLEAWDRYHAASKAGWWKRLVAGASHLWTYITPDDLEKKDLVPIDRIATVAVWDTVGALGIPSYENDERADEFQFASRKLSDKVEAGFHAVSLDERRVDFTPTLWNARKNVTQMLFAGAHADVGGGYPTRDKQSGLSNIALRWMVEQLQGRGLRFDEAAVKAHDPDPSGCAHKPWAEGVFAKRRHGDRRFPGGIDAHPSIEARKALPGVLANPDEALSKYEPKNLPG